MTATEHSDELTLIEVVCKYRVHLFPPDDPWHQTWSDLAIYTIEIEDRETPDTDRRWSVNRSAFVWHDQDGWVVPHSPSNRTKKELRHTRFTFVQARDIALREAQRQRKELISRWVA